MDGSWQVAYGKTCHDYQEDWSQKQSFLQVMKKWGQDRQTYSATLFAKYPWAEGNVKNL